MYILDLNDFHVLTLGEDPNTGMLTSVQNLVSKSYVCFAMASADST